MNLSCDYLWFALNAKEFAMTSARKHELRMWLVEYPKAKKGHYQRQGGYYIAKTKSVITKAINEPKAIITEVEL